MSNDGKADSEKQGGNGAPAAAAPKVGWLKGHLRSEVQASECAYLHPELLVEASIEQRETDLDIGMPGGRAGKAVEQRWSVLSIPENTLKCHSPRLAAAHLARVHPQVQQQVAALLQAGIPTRLEFCRLCPFWERPQ